MKILIVDDSLAMRRIISRQLQQIGFGDRILDAANGREALEVIRRERPDLVIADYNMPEMSGLELLQAAKEVQFSPNFGFVTSDALRVRAIAFQAGAAFVLSKPLTIEALKEALGITPSRRRIPMPSNDQLGKLLDDLLGTAVKVTPSLKMVLAGLKPVLVGLYELDSGAPAALVASELDLAASVAGAMLGSTPAEVRAELEQGKLSEVLMDCAREFFNVAGGLFNVAGAAPVTFRAVHAQLRALPPRAVAMAVRPSAHVTVEIAVPDYGRGCMSVIVG